MLGGQFRESARRVRELINGRGVLRFDSPVLLARASGAVARLGLQVLETTKAMRPNLPLALLSVSLCAAWLFSGARVVAGQAGAVASWGKTHMTPVEAGTRFRAVTAQVGELAITSDGTVVAWGGKSAGWAVPAGLSGVIAISSGMYHNLALRSDGTVAGWGDNSFGEAVAPEGLSGVVAVAAGDLLQPGAEERRRRSWLGATTVRRRRRRLG